MSIRLKLTILFLAVVIIPLFFVSVVTFWDYKKSLETTQLSRLQDLATFKAKRIEAYFEEFRDEIEMAQSFYIIRKNLPLLLRFMDDPDNEEISEARKLLDRQLQEIQVSLELSDIMLANRDG
jgi:hypothetical protein